eukprot:1137560-Pelagomonas_calceolata.AAC.3
MVGTRPTSDMVSPRNGILVKASQLPPAVAQGWWSGGQVMPLCKTSRLQNVKAHESGKQHKGRAAAWQQAQDKASWHQLMDKGAKRQEIAAGEPCARAFKRRKFSIASFPYPRAIE